MIGELDWSGTRLKAKWPNTKLYVVQQSHRPMMLSVGIADIPCGSELLWNSS